MTVESETRLREHQPRYKEARPEPIEIFPRQELRPEVKKTPKMLEVEMLVGCDLGEFLITKYSTDSPNSIRREISDMSGGKVNVGEEATRKWLKAYGIQIRSRAEGIRLAWKNPEKRESMITTVHTPEANKKRGKAVSAHWENLPEEEKQERLRRLRKGYNLGKTNRRETLAKKMQDALGGSPEEVLRRMYWEQGFSVNEIGRKINKSGYTVTTWMKRLGIERRKKGGAGSIRTNSEGKRMTVQQARDKGLLEILTPKELAVTNARYPPDGNRIKSFSDILKESYPNSRAKTRQAVQGVDQRMIKKLARALKG